jgi:hypothetical protein
MSPFIIAILTAIIIVATVVVSCKYSKRSNNGRETVCIIGAKIHALAAQASYWQAMSIKDKDPFAAMLHSSYALSFASAVLQLVGEQDASRIAQQDIGDLLTRIKSTHALNIAAVNMAHDGPPIDPALALVQPLS